MAVFATFSWTPVKILRTSVDDFCHVCNVNIAISGCGHFHLFEGKTSLQKNVGGRLSQVLGFEVTRENGLSSQDWKFEWFYEKVQRKGVGNTEIQYELSISGAHTQGPRVKRGHRSSPSSSSPHAKKSSGSSFWIRPKRILKQSNDSNSLAAMPFHEELVIPMKPKTVTSSVEVRNFSIFFYMLNTFCFLNLVENVNNNSMHLCEKWLRE